MSGSLAIGVALCTLPRMRFSDLTPQQCQLIEGQVAQRWRYLDNLHTRMRHQQFPADDPLLVAVVKAKGSLEELVGLLHARTAPVVSPPPNFDSTCGKHPGMPPKRND